MPEKSQRNLPVRVVAISAGGSQSGSQGVTSGLIGLRPGSEPKKEVFRENT